LRLHQILIVTEKLLTGFDAPILYCMYLDKPMRDHVLLQAIARVNRPYEDDDGQVKPYGFVRSGTACRSHSCSQIGDRAEKLALKSGLSAYFAKKSASERMDFRCSTCMPLIVQ